MLEIQIEKLSFVIALLRKYGALFPASGLDDERSSDQVDIAAESPIAEELEDCISDLKYSEKIELVALLWMGRGDYTEADWTEARNQAEDEHEGHAIAGYVMGTPNAGEFLEEALSLMGYSLADVEDGY